MANTTDLRFTKTSATTSAILNAMAADMRSRVLALGVRAMCQPIEIAAKRNAKRSERTGALRESITTKVVNYPESGKAVGLVGPDRAYYAGGRKVGKLGALFGAGKPANYAHLVEYGHHAVAPKKGTSIRKKSATVTTWVPAKPFLRPAALTTSDDQSVAFYQAIDRAIKREGLKAA